MPSFGKMVAAVAMALMGQALAAPPAQASPEAFLRVMSKPNNFVVTKNNTINSTAVHTNNKDVASVSPNSPLPLTFTNNYGGPASQSGDSRVFAYVTGLDGDGAAFFLRANGQPYYPPNPQAGIPPTPITDDIAIPLSGRGGSVTVNLPNYISSGRIYYSVGTMQFAANHGPNGAVIVAPSFSNPSDPSIDVNYGFTEFTWNAQEIYSNLSYVDFIGLVVSQTLEGSAGTCNVRGLPANAVSTICSGLAAQGARDGQAWAKSCQADNNGNVLRVLAPLHLTEVQAGALNGYYDNYINQVWSRYQNEDLTITGDSLGTFTGRVDGGTGLLSFNGVTFAKPVLQDILGCNSGPFANPGGAQDPVTKLKQVVVPRLCAAFYRSTLLLNGGNQQPDGVPVSSYYPDNVPTMWYAKLVHQVEIDRGYAFSYDDVTPAGAPDQSGACVDGAPSHITFTVGGE